ncbi:MAG: phenylacetate-CoA oxygenase/reductase subunit PaaK [Chitinophagaceae bacterium]|nr:phenylacetate-CoA oxygenase/reductase subunit PaaK [Bacteroidota bacterium]MCC6258880.1 phenylacetate-CoA oxygenase/reductase subunit PaaK [Chitinophagaceae bacterium]
MAVHFEPLTVKRVVHETPECVSISFEIPEIIQDKFLFKEGQNITIRYANGKEEVRRSYSICNAPHEMELRIAVKEVPGGVFSVFANHALKAGDVLEILPPTGKFNAKMREGNRPYRHLAIAAGSGITPVISIIKHILHQNSKSSFTLIYVNRTRQSIIFFEELEAIKNKYPERFQLVHILSREMLDTELFFGRLDMEKLAQLQPLIPYAQFNEVYICGPEEMIFNSKEFLETAGVPAANIHFELFTVPGEKKLHEQVLEIQENSGPVSHVSVHLDGRTLEFDLPMNGPSILDGALAQGADLPFSCKGGVCATCRAKLEEGKVEMDKNYALEKEEIEQGFILTCQSHPRSERIFVNFDER